VSAALSAGSLRDFVDIRFHQAVHGNAKANALPKCTRQQYSCTRYVTHVILIVSPREAAFLCASPSSVSRLTHRCVPACASADRAVFARR
jgi:hypothetical protein